VSRSRLARYGLAALGVGFVGMAAAGVVVPGLPTTIFLILAAWCFARSCPWLADKLIHNRFFGPFVKYLEPGAVMPRRAKVVALVIMWTAIAGSCWLIVSRGLPLLIPGAVILAGIVGTWYIARQGCKLCEKPAGVERHGRCPFAGQGGGQSAGPGGDHDRGHMNPPCTTKTGASSTTR
jgi:uncharacterized membrane protein YbaN (DUF454 family)